MIGDAIGLGQNALHDGTQASWPSSSTAFSRSRASLCSPATWITRPSGNRLLVDWQPHRMPRLAATFIGGKAVFAAEASLHLAG